MLLKYDFKWEIQPIDENNQIIFSPKIRVTFLILKNHIGDLLPLVVRLYWSDENAKNLTLGF